MRDGKDQGASAVGASSDEAAMGSPATSDQPEVRPALTKEQIEAYRADNLVTQVTARTEAWAIEENRVTNLICDMALRCLEHEKPSLADQLRARGVKPHGKPRIFI